MKKLLIVALVAVYVAAAAATTLKTDSKVAETKNLPVQAVDSPKSTAIASWD
ncbi:MAG: hypothetical protein ABIP95_02240 [Pelobium sp.]